MVHARRAHSLLEAKLKAWRWAFTEAVLGHHRGIVVQVEAGLALPLFSLVVEMDGRDRVSMQSHTRIWA
jgi:hypothetical protein